MKKFPKTLRGILLISAAFAALWLAAALPAQAATHPQYDKFTGQILSVTRTGIMVKGIGTYGVRNFTYDAKLAAKIAKLMSKPKPKHGYHDGQDVEIVYVRGSDVAARIKAKA